MSINENNIVDVKDLALPGQRVIKINQDGKEILIPVGLSSLNPLISIPDGITVKPADVKQNVFFIDSTGNKVAGEMPDFGEVSIIPKYSPQEFPEGYYSKITVADIDDVAQTEIKPFKCVYPRYTAESVVMKITEPAGVKTNSGYHLSFVGTYVCQESGALWWECPETTAFEHNGIEYSSVQAAIVNNYSGVNLYNWEILQKRTGVWAQACHQINTALRVAYPWLLGTDQWEEELDFIPPVIVPVNEENFVTSGSLWNAMLINPKTGELLNELNMYAHIRGFTPEVGGIYSEDTKIKMTLYGE